MPSSAAGTPCVFCAIDTGRAPATVTHRWPDALAIRPLHPVTPGHLLIIPHIHVPDAGTDPTLAGHVMARAAELVTDLPAANVITSKGTAATQTVPHLHLHVVPRRPGDGLHLPWTGQAR